MFMAALARLSRGFSRERPLGSVISVKIDPGSKTTGIVLVEEANREVLFAGEIQHRGAKIRKALLDRRAQFGHPEVRQAAGRLLRDAAVVSASRWAVWRRSQSLELRLETAWSTASARAILSGPWCPKAKGSVSTLNGSAPPHG